jgi:hypothetical protein
MPKINRSTPQTTRSKPRRQARRPLVAKPRRSALGRGAERYLIMGAAAVGMGATVAAAVMARSQLRRLAVTAAREVISASHHGEALGRKIGTSIGREASGVDLSRLLTYTGLKKRPSLLARALPSIGVLAALVAAGGSAIFMFVPKPRAASREEGPRRVDNGYSWSNATSEVADGSVSAHDSHDHLNGDGEVASKAVD